MKGNMKVFFKFVTGESIMVKLSEVLKNEKVINVIKNNFGKNIRGATVELEGDNDCHLLIEKKSEIYEIEIPKKDFQDAMSFVEEYVDEKKLNKKGHQLEIVDISI